MNYSIRAITLAFMLLLGYSCQKSAVQHTSDDTLPIKQVQEAFSVIQPSRPEEGSRAPNSDFHNPDWKRATWVPRKGAWSYWRVPLTSQHKQIRVTVVENAEKKTRQTIVLPEPWLMAYEDSSKNVVFYVVQEEPRLPGKDKQSGLAASDRFTGDLNIYTWSGSFQYSIGYENGIRKTRTTRGKRKPSSESARYEYDCDSQEICIWEANCTFNDNGVYTVTRVVLRQVNPSPNMCLGSPSYTAHDVFFDEFGQQIDPSIIYSCEDGWRSLGAETSTTCTWKWIPDGTDPDPDPGTGGGDPGSGSGGDIGDITDPNWTPQMEIDPCQAKKFITQFVARPAVTSALTKVRQKLTAQPLEWGTPIWYTTFADPTTLTSGIATAGTVGTWTYNFIWSTVSNKYMISDVHLHPNNTPPSPTDIFGLLINVYKVKAQSNNNLHVKHYMQNASIFVISSNAEWVITPGDWTMLDNLYQEYLADPAAFDAMVTQKAVAYQNSTRAIQEVFGYSINIFMSAPGSNNFVPVSYNASQNLMLEIPCN